MRLKQRERGQRDPVWGERVQRGKWKTSMANFIIGAWNALCSWGEVKWLKGYHHPRIMESEKQETLNSVLSEVVQKDRNSQLKGKNNTYAQIEGSFVSETANLLH